MAIKIVLVMLKDRKALRGGSVFEGKFNIKDEWVIDERRHIL